MKHIFAFLVLLFIHTIFYFAAIGAGDWLGLTWFFIFGSWAGAISSGVWVKTRD